MRWWIGVVALAVLLFVVVRRRGDYALARTGTYGTHTQYWPTPLGWVGVQRGGDGVVVGSHSGTQLVVARSGQAEGWSQCIDLVDADGGAGVWRRCLGFDFQPWIVSVSDDRKWIAIGGRERYSGADRVVVADADSGTILHRFEAEAGAGARMCWLDGTGTLVMQRGGMIELAKGPDWVAAPWRAGRLAEFLGGGRKVAYVNDAGRVSMAPIAAGETEELLAIEAVGPVRVSKDGRRVLFIDRGGGTPMVWKAEEGRATAMRFLFVKEHPVVLEWVGER